MADFIELSFDDGTRLALQAFAPLPRAAGDGGQGDGRGTDEPVPGFGESRPVARGGGRMIAATEGALRTLLAPIVPVLQQVHDTVSTVPDPPHELSVSFGVRIGQDLKIGIVGAAAEATMTVAALWHLDTESASSATTAPSGHSG
ncbi:MULTISPECIES: CU044_2847 family protein [unclassified Streptomyces]|uniref:CU044_2847 family protein n=1 Tax=unclassified Streptomyces TaxID=2593676 RepID=UPI00278C4867|nr:MULTISPECIES: CU044_2847 family protein [unclassified Streptomyces]